ncbi:MAG: prepilin-type N-terminal cleavage/methylation domain-containing protein [Verrucomicrobiae bacterium]
MNPARTAFKKSAFTLLELLVAMVVFALLLVMLLGMVDTSAKLWRDGEGRVDSYREARAALGVMSRDLGNLVATTNTGQFLLKSNAHQLVPAIAGITTNSAVFFLSALPAGAQDPASNRSDVCQVGYFLAFGKSSGASNAPVNTMNIYRYLLSSDPAFHRLTNPSPPLFPGDLATAGDPRVELLARNITSLTLIAYTATNNSLTNFDSTNTPIPDLVEIRISAVNQDTAKKLGGNMADWTDPNSPAIRAAVQSFSTRIKINRPQQAP